jgi:hypothetical protein
MFDIDRRHIKASTRWPFRPCLFCPLYIPPDLFLPTHTYTILSSTRSQRCGHKPVALLGGATGRVGDPSGKSSERPILSEELIERNIAGIGAILRGLLKARAGEGAAPQVGFFIGRYSMFLKCHKKTASIHTMFSWFKAGALSKLRSLLSIAICFLFISSNCLPLFFISASCCANRC